MQQPIQLRKGERMLLCLVEKMNGLMWIVIIA